MRVPKRKAGEYSYKMDPYITEEKFNKLQKRLDRLKIEHRQGVKEMQMHASDGDFSENAPYQTAKWQVRRLLGSIEKIENILKHSKIIKKDSNNQSVQLGNSVTLEIGNKIRVYQILGSGETNPMKGIISYSSPLGSAMLDKRIGDEFEVNANGKKVRYRVVGIE